MSRAAAALKASKQKKKSDPVANFSSSFALSFFLPRGLKNQGVVSRVKSWYVLVEIILIEV